jgi:ribosomal protein L11 methyltransferase
VLDVGCGSGVLAIAAAKLGFSPVVAVDKDGQAIEATRRNAATNGVHLDLRQVDALEEELPTAQQVLANITKEAVEAVAPRLRCESLIASGYLVSDPGLLPGYRHVDRVTEEGWAADRYERESRPQ